MTIREQGTEDDAGTVLVEGRTFGGSSFSKYAGAWANDAYEIADDLPSTYVDFLTFFLPPACVCFSCDCSSNATDARPPVGGRTRCSVAGCHHNPARCHRCMAIRSNWRRVAAF